LLFAGLLDTTEAGMPALPMDIRFIDTSMFGLQFGARMTSAFKLEGKFAYNHEQATRGYELVNIAFAWDPLASLRVEARIDNLLDETYQDHLVGINRASDSGMAVGERLYGPERTLSAGVIFSF
jgi:outer membrane receptor protein involved in Fe transport